MRRSGEIGKSSSNEASRRLGLPKSTIENWVRAAKKGALGEESKSHRPLTDVEQALSQPKRKLAQVKMERDILINTMLAI